MIISNTLEQTLKGGYKGLYGEVVERDTYYLRDLPDIVSINPPYEVHQKGHKKKINFIPDVIIDLGANVGIFSRYARKLFPDALIVSVEPNEENFLTFKKFTHDNNTICLNKAIGIGNIWHGLSAANGSGETYLSEGLGYPQSEFLKDTTVEKSTIETIMPNELIKKYVKGSDKFIVKIDIEGAENFIFTHKPSMDALRAANYICMELHWFAQHGGLSEEVKEKTTEALKSFDRTHICELDNQHFYAVKK